MSVRRINGLILAAGCSSRMGAFKPLLPLRGKTLIENAIDSMLLAGVSRIVVVLGCRGAEVEALLRSQYLSDTLILTRNPLYAATDMLASVKIGLSVLPDCDAFFLLPGDMPVVTKETYLAVYRAMEESDAAIAFPTLDGYWKHPPLISSALMDEIQRFHGSGGLRELWSRYDGRIAAAAVDDVGCRTDLDTFAQYRQCAARCQSEAQDG